MIKKTSLHSGSALMWAPGVCLESIPNSEVCSSSNHSFMPLRPSSVVSQGCLDNLELRNCKANIWLGVSKNAELVKAQRYRLSRSYLHVN